MKLSPRREKLFYFQYVSKKNSNMLHIKNQCIYNTYFKNEEYSFAQLVKIEKMSKIVRFKLNHRSEAKIIVIYN